MAIRDSTMGGATSRLQVSRSKAARRHQGDKRSRNRTSRLYHLRLTLSGHERSRQASRNQGTTKRSYLRSHLYSKKSQKPKFQCLILGDGQTAEWFGGGQPTFHGVSWMPNIGESPSVERESSLWQIIRLNAPQKYSLSPKACQGILRRAMNRCKELPELLRLTLEKQAKE